MQNGRLCDHSKQKDGYITDWLKNTMSLDNASVGDYAEVSPSLQPLYNLGLELSSVLGLDKLEGLIYLSLLRMGPVTTSMLSRELEIERTKTYRIVEKMINDGIISMTFSSPKLCVPVDLEEVFRKIIQKKNDEIKRINLVKEKTIQRIKSMVNMNYDFNMPTFRIIHGQDSIYSDIEMLLDKSSDVTYIVTTFNDVSKMYHSNIPQKIKKCIKNGASVRLIIDKDNETVNTLINRLNIREAKIGKLTSKGRIIVSKNMQMIMSDSVQPDNAKNDADYALSTNSTEMVKNVFNLCTFLWKTSKPLSLSKS